MNTVLDASAMIAFLRDEMGAELVADQLQLAHSHVFAHALNLCEVYYDFLRASGEETALSAVNDLLALGITERGDMHAAFWKTMGQLKARHRRVALADCAALSLAIDLSAALLTADRHELQLLSEAGVCQIHFIR